MVPSLSVHPLPAWRTLGGWGAFRVYGEGALGPRQRRGWWHKRPRSWGQRWAGGAKLGLHGTSLAALRRRAAIRTTRPLPVQGPQSPHCGRDHPRRQAGWLHTTRGPGAQPDWAVVQCGTPTFSETPVLPIPVERSFQGAPPGLAWAASTGCPPPAWPALVPWPPNTVWRRVFLRQLICAEDGSGRSSSGQGSVDGSAPRLCPGNERGRAGKGI